MWTYNYSRSPELYHHGVLGMKWGIRKEYEPVGRKSKVPKPPKPKSKHRLKLENKYLQKGKTQEEAEKAAAKRIRVEKILAAAGVLTVAAVTAHYAKKGAEFLYDQLYIQPSLAHTFDSAWNTGVKDVKDIPKIKGNHDYLDDLAKINPRYKYAAPLPKSKKDPVSVWRTNCGYCSVAYEMRRRGYDVEAVSNGTGMLLGDKGTMSTIFSGIKFQKAKAGHGGAGLWDIVAAGKEWGEGSRGVINAVWKDGTAHAFNFEIINGAPKFLDGQTNDDAVFYYLGDSKKLEFARVDNLPFGPVLLDAIAIPL